MKIAFYKIDTGGDYLIKDEAEGDSVKLYHNSFAGSCTSITTREWVRQGDHGNWERF